MKKKPPVREQNLRRRLFYLSAGPRPSTSVNRRGPATAKWDAVNTGMATKSANGRNLHGSILMGPELPWYAAEKTTVFISVANPFPLYDAPGVPVCINTCNGSREAIRQAVEKVTGKSEFKGNSPVDAFCRMWATRL